MGLNLVAELESVVKTYNMGTESLQALDHVDFQLFEGEFVSVLGPSGSGKTTLMNILGCLDAPTSGTYKLNGSLVSGLMEPELARIRNKEIGFVFQQFQLLSRLTALENVELPLIYARMAEKERKGLAAWMLEAVGLKDKLNSYPNQLSWGQQQRVAISRALATKPSMLLCDEPTGSLDQKTGAQVMALFEKLNEEGRSIVVITHDQSIASRASRVVRLLDGKVEIEGSQIALEAK